MDALSTQRNIQSARVPEACVRMNEPIVGRAHERIDVDLLGLLVERVAQDLPDRQSAIEDRRALVERAQLSCMQREAASRRVGLEHRWLLQARKLTFGSTAARIHLDVDTRDQS